ncbi:DNA repair helicase [Raphidocelis subcapitata]|uniref:DNA 5'-3' helicase n=1 Tax=Raphidocelis subcapitata TaxID=307507 RepID=A0A2V0PJZ6_9CHLO|nr:DNA repair helicase [Raphidocelis subcapitata]|eukprot:GBG00047.1 DNA repair helicase [Raphidocelis subcapitata]
MRFLLDGLTVYFPYEFIYPEQYQYMAELKAALDARGHVLLEMPTGTGKTITLLSLITSYQLAHPEVGKLVYCTRTVPEMEKVLAELRELVAYRDKYLAPTPPAILALGLSSRKNLCIHPVVAEEGSRESVDAGCRRLTASWTRARAERDASVELCDFFEAHEAAGQEALLPPGGGLFWGGGRTMVSRELEKECIVVFDEAHNIDNVCIEALSVSLRQHTLRGARGNISRLENAVRDAQRANKAKLDAEYQRLVQHVTSEGPASFLARVQEAVRVDAKTLRFCYDRLSSLLKTLEVSDTDDLTPLQLVADFGTLLGTYQQVWGGG